MPAMSKGEKPKKERKMRSLSTKVFRMFLLGTVVLGLILECIGLTLYSIAVANQYIATSFSLSRNASKALQEILNTAPLSGEVLGRYRNMTEAERAAVGTEEYETRFADLPEREDYQSIRATLAFFLESSDVYDI